MVHHDAILLPHIFKGGNAMTLIRKIFTICICLLLALQLPVSALAAIEANVSYGDVTIGDVDVTHTPEAGAAAVTQSHGGSVTVTGSTTQNKITVDVSAGNTVEVTLQDVNIERTGDAMHLKGEGNVVVELDGKNTLKSDGAAGLKTSDDGGSLTIQDKNSVSGSLTAQGGNNGAGIGGGRDEINYRDASNITITGGTIYAEGGSGAGIGGAKYGSGSNITITGNAKVTAVCGDATGAAGIGGGPGGTGSNITISGNAKVTAIGGTYAADIGDGSQGNYVKPENNVDTSFLTPNGSVNGVPGTYVIPAPPTVSPFVLNRAYTLSKQDGVMKLTVKGEDAVLTIKTWGMEQLIAQGIHTLILVTDKAETALDLNELLENPGTYVLKHKGTETTLTRGGEIVK